MICIVIGLVCFMILVIFHTLYSKSMKVELLAICSISIILGFGVITLIDYKSQTDDVEIWSGKIIDVKHTEEYDIWIPPREETYTTTNSKGKTETHTRTIAGYWEHHKAKNSIETTDNGTMSVSATLDGREFTDDFVNSTSELEKYYPIGKATATTHTYENKLKASYSVFKNKDIKLSDYKGLPEYPSNVNNELTIDRLIGKFENKKVLSKKLDDINTRLNDTDNPKNKQKIKSYKQVNLMMINFGEKSEDYGWALQDYWKNGAKNDFVVTFGTDSKGKITWCHAFSWTDVEILKSDVREYIIGKNVKEFDKCIDDIGNMVENKFDRKQFKDFDYIQVDVSSTARVVMISLFVIMCLVYCFVDDKKYKI